MSSYVTRKPKRARLGHPSLKIMQLRITSCIYDLVVIKYVWRSGARLNINSSRDVSSLRIMTSQNT
jgi:hypothetical protein